MTLPRPIQWSSDDREGISYDLEYGSAYTFFIAHRGFEDMRAVNISEFAHFLMLRREDHEPVQQEDLQVWLGAHNGRGGVNLLPAKWKEQQLGDSIIVTVFGTTAELGKFRARYSI